MLHQEWHFFLHIRIVSYTLAFFPAQVEKVSLVLLFSYFKSFQNHNILIILGSKFHYPMIIDCLELLAMLCKVIITDLHETT